MSIGDCKHFINKSSPTLLKISRTSLFVQFDENKKFFKNLLTNLSKCGIIVSERERNTKNLNPLQKENKMKMTKTAMINYIEKTGMVLNFSRSWFNSMLKEEVIRFYEMAQAYAERYNLKIEG